MKYLTVTAILLMMVLDFSSCSINKTIAEGTTLRYRFADLKTARELASGDDEYMLSLSKLDMAARMQTNQPDELNIAQYNVFERNQMLEWNETEKKRISGLIESHLMPRLKNIHVPLPAEILLIKSTGKEQFNMAFTRKNAIFLPLAKLQRLDSALARTICHELIHIASRNNILWRESGYRALGFYNFGQLDMRAIFGENYLTNPDAPSVSHFTTCNLNGHTIFVLPVLACDTAVYLPERKSPKNYTIGFPVLLQLTFDAYGKIRPAVDPGNKPVLLKVSEVDNYSQRRFNTDYLIAPEEIFVENVVQMIYREKFAGGIDVLLSR